MYNVCQRDRSTNCVARIYRATRVLIPSSHRQYGQYADTPCQRSLTTQRMQLNRPRTYGFHSEIRPSWSTCTLAYLDLSPVSCWLGWRMLGK